MKMFRFIVCAAALIFGNMAPAIAQWQTPAHSVPIGQGAGVTGFGSAVPGTAGIPLTSSGASFDPTFGPISNAGLGTAPANTAKCNPTGSTAAIQDCTAAQLQASLGLSPLAASAPKTANYPIVSTDINSVITMGTGTTAQLTATLPSLPSAGFTAGAVIYVKNGDVYSGIGTGHAMTLIGFPSDLLPGCGGGGKCLWPGQIVAVQVNAAATGWITLINPGRWLIPTSAEICMAQNGNDANDGLGSGTGCMQTMQAVLGIIGNQWDGGGYNSCSIGVYAGGTNTIAGNVNQTGQSVGCYITINIRGNITWASTGACFTGGDNSITIINWNLGFIPTFKCNSANTASTGQLKCHQYCIWDINGGTAIWLPAGNLDVFFDCDLQCSATYNAQVNVGDGISTYTPFAFIQCEAHCSKVTVSGVLAFSALVTMDHVYGLKSGSVITTGITYPGVTATNPTVPSGGSVFITNGTTIPGGTTPAAPGSGCAQNALFGLVCLTAF